MAESSSSPNGQIEEAAAMQEGGLFVPDRPFYVQAMYAYASNEASSLSFDRGQVIEVLSTLASGWWDGVLLHSRVRGWFPSNYVQKVSEEEAVWAVSAANNARNSLTADQTLERLMNGNDLAFSSATTTGITTDATTSAYEADTSDQAAGEQLEDLWLPRMTKTGQLFYYNSRTKETSRDLPVDGIGDGSVVPREEFASSDAESERSRTNKRTGKWRQQYTSDGAAMYYVNDETGEQSWTRPAEVRTEADGVSQLDVPQSLYSRQSVGAMSAWTERTAVPKDASDGEEGSAAESDVDARPAVPPKDGFEAMPDIKRKSRQLARKALARELIDVPPPPLLEDLEVLVTRALQGLIAAVAPPLDRPRLAGAIEAAVAALRATLHATSALDYPISQASTSAALPYFVPPTISNNVIVGSFGQSTSMSFEVLVQLRPYHRRLVSTFSKVIFSARALWGTLETLEEDQPVSSEDILIYSDEEIMTMRSSWAISQTARFEHAEKLRTEVASGADEVRSHFASFVAQFEALSADGTVALNVPRPLLRAPRALQGALRTSAAAILLPGGGHGGNWRGNGFVTLPDRVLASSNESNLTASGALSYMYPSRRLDQSTLAHIAAECSGLATDASSAVETDQIARQAMSLQSRLAGLLQTLEDLDLAASIDTEIRGKADDQSFTTPAEFVEGQESKTETELVKFQASVAEAKILLAAFRTRKQALYDLSALLLCAAQDALLVANRVERRSTARGPQPFDAMTSALSGPERSAKEQVTLAQVLERLAPALNDVRTNVDGLYGVAKKQDSAPKDIRRSLVVRHSLKPSPSTSSLEQLASSIAPSSTDHSNRQSGVYGRTGSSANASRQSVDSDFFFSNGSAAVASSSQQHSRTAISTLSSTQGRSPSLRTNSSATSEPFSSRQDSLDSPSRSPSKKSKLTKLLGAEAATSGRAAAQEQTAWYLGSDYGPDDISFNMEGQVRGGTLRGLVIAATSHEGRVESNYLSTFLLTLRTFCTPQQLLDQLVERYSIRPPAELGPDELRIWESRKLRPIRARVANMIKAWVREYIDADERNMPVLQQIARFAAQEMRDPVQSPQIIKAVDERLAGNAPRPIGSLAPGPLPPSIVPRTFRKLKLSDIDPLEAARQLTIMEGRYFSRITPEECLAKAWPKEYAPETPNISAMIEMSNAVTRWVTETILAIEDVKKRASMVKVFVQIGERCLSLNNFSTLIHIIAGLNSTPIHRLRRTWENVSQKTMFTLGTLNKVMRPDKNYKEYRETLRRVTPPCVPFFGVYLTDWTFIGDGNPDMLRDKPHQINFNKRQKAAELILSIRLHQATTYNLAAVPALVKFFEEQLFSPAKATDQQLYDLSLHREPRERDDEKIARLLSESGFL